MRYLKIFVAGFMALALIIGSQPVAAARSRADTIPPKECLKYGSKKVLCASKTDGKVYAIRNGKMVYGKGVMADGAWGTARFGGTVTDKNGKKHTYFTREDSKREVKFKVLAKSNTARSNLYFDAQGRGIKMPYWMQFDGGEGFHYSSDFNKGDPYSHGCIGFKYESVAKWFYDWTPVNTIVIVTKN